MQAISSKNSPVKDYNAIRNEYTLPEVVKLTTYASFLDDLETAIHKDIELTSGANK